MQKIFKSIFIVFFCLIISSCSGSSDNRKYIPVFMNNKECVIEYLNEIEFPVKAEIKDIPFNVNTPSSQLIGFLELVPDNKRNMKSIYKGLQEFCYSSEVIQGKLDKNDWSELIEDVRLIYKNNRYGNIDTEKPIYIEVDNKREKFVIFQDGINYKKK